jgi:hypothetical protein
MALPPLADIRNGIPTLSWYGICTTIVLLTALSTVGFLGFRLAFDLLLGSTIDLSPGILLAATIPTGIVLGIQLRAQLKKLKSRAG